MDTAGFATTSLLLILLKLMVGYQVYDAAPLACSKIDCPLQIMLSLVKVNCGAP